MHGTRTVHTQACTCTHLLHCTHTLHRLDYFVHTTAVLRCTGAGLGVRLDEWNAVLELEPGIRSWHVHVHGVCTACSRHVHGKCSACARCITRCMHHNNAPLMFEPGGAAEGVLSEGDVLVSIDGVSCAEAILTQARHRACVSAW